MNIQFESRLFREGHPKGILRFGIGATLVILACVVVLTLGGSPWFYLGILGAVLVAGVGIFALLREMQWCEIYPDRIAIQSPFGRVTEVLYAELEGVSVHDFARKGAKEKKEFYILWDARPLRHGIHGYRGLNRRQVAVRIPVTNETTAFLSLIPVMEPLRHDRELIIEALAGEEATFLWRGTIYELIARPDGKLDFYRQEDDAESTLIAVFENKDDFLRRGMLANSPVHMIASPLPAPTDFDGEHLRDTLVHTFADAQWQDFRQSEEWQALAAHGRLSDLPVEGENRFWRPSPSIAYVCTMDVSVGGVPHRCQTVWADEVGHLELCPWRSNARFMAEISPYLTEHEEKELL